MLLSASETARTFAKDMAAGTAWLWSFETVDVLGRLEPPADLDALEQRIAFGVRSRTRSLALDASGCLGSPPFSRTGCGIGAARGTASPATGAGLGRWKVLDLLSLPLGTRVN